MQNDDRSVASTSTPSDPDWPAQHPALDAAIAAAIRAPAAGAELEQQVWARIRADAEAESSATSVQRQVGTPLWLSVLNAIAVSVVAVMVVLAVGTATQPAEQSAHVALALLERSPSSMRVALCAASGIGLWLALRGTPWARAIGLSLGPERAAPRR